MGIFDIFKKPATDKIKADVYVEENKLVIPREKLDVIIESIKKDTVRKVINIKTDEKADLKLTESKFGGYPYWPSGMEYPVNSAGDKLVLLAQINLSDVNDPLLPDAGLLQFFISCDDINGLDDDKGYKVVYHKDIDPSVTEASVKELGIKAASDLDVENDEYMPLSKSYALTFSEDTEYINHRCNTFEKAFSDRLKELYDIDMDEIEIDGYYKLYNFLNKEDYEYLTDALNDGTGHKIFGYPFFTQEDPRENGENDILLFQMDTDGEDIMWGDSGVGGFFINEENLKNLDFDKAVYNWDCY